MLELRLTADAKRIASMREAIGRECMRMKADAQHAEVVALVVEQLVVDPVEKGARPSRAGRRTPRAAQAARVTPPPEDR